MHLAFEHRELRDICLNEAAAVEEFGTEMSAYLRALLADMIAAETLAELVTGNLRADSGREPEVFIVDLGQLGRLAFRANHPKSDAAKVAALKLDRISRIIVISVEVNYAESS